MRIHSVALAGLFAMSVSSLGGRAWSQAVGDGGPVLVAPAESSSSAMPPEAPASDHAVGLAAGVESTGAGTSYKSSSHAFSSIAIAVKMGFAGAGFDVATPLARRLNLRAGASFFTYAPTLTVDNIDIIGGIQFRSVNASLDIYPFAGKFRISPGIILYNGNNVNATATVPGGQTFSLNDVNYVSSATNPVSGTFGVKSSSTVAPSFTAGFGNMIPSKGRWSVPVEVGFEYISAPVATLSLTGSVCQGPGNTNCSPIAGNATVQANVQQEQINLTNDMSALKFYPIASIGLSYKFGGGKK